MIMCNRTPATGLDMEQFREKRVIVVSGQLLSLGTGIDLFIG
jgi:hypothetical protein